MNQNRLTTWDVLKGMFFLFVMFVVLSAFLGVFGMILSGVIVVLTVVAVLGNAYLQDVESARHLEELRFNMIETARVAEEKAEEARLAEEEVVAANLEAQSAAQEAREAHRLVEEENVRLAQEELAVARQELVVARQELADALADKQRVADLLRSQGWMVADENAPEN